MSKVKEKSGVISFELSVLFLLVNKVYEINCSSFELEQAGIGSATAAGAASKCMAASLVFSKMAEMLS